MSETSIEPQATTAAQTQVIASGTKQLIKKKSAELLFDMATQEFVLVNPSDFPAFKKDVDAFDAFKPYMDVFFPEHKINEKQQAAEIKAVLAIIKEYVDEKDDGKSEKIIKNLAEKIEEKKKEYLNSPNVAQGEKMKSGEIKEYLWASGSKSIRSRVIRLRTKKVTGYKWKTFKLDTKKFKEELEKDKARKEKAEHPQESNKEGEKENEKHPVANKLLKHIKKPEKEFELNLFEEKLFDAEKVFLPLKERNFFEEIDQIDAGIGAQMFRLSAECAVESVVDWKNHKIKSALKGSASASLIQAKGHFTVYLPDYNGWDVWATLRKIDPKIVKSNAKPLYLLLKFNIDGSAFVGACASIGLETGISLGDAKKKDSGEAVADASLDLFAGAKASAQASASGSMKLISDKDVSQKADWETLGEITWGIWGAVGIGLTFGFRVGWWDGKLGYEAKMGVVLKLGAGTSIKGTVAPIKIGQFLYTIAVSVDWLKLSDIFEGQVHSLFDSFMRDCLFTEKTIEDVVKEMQDHLPQIMSATTEVLEQEFGVLKAVDDSFDHYIPGYSGYKKHSATFWLLKSTYNFLREINTAKSIKDNTITQVNFIEQGKRWKYATWQMKVNFVTDMTQGMGAISRYSESERQRAMLAVFRSARNSSEFQKMHLCVTNADELFEDTYKVEFDNLKIRFK